MAARSIATATISFGLVSIPVKLYSASAPNAGIHFNILHKKCGHRIKQQYWCETDEEVVPRSETIKGYEFSKNNYVTFTEEELEKLEAVATQSIDITEFLPAKTVEAVYFDKSYYLGPDRGGDRAYRLLSAALRKTGRVAVAKYAARGKQYLVLVAPKDDGLVLQQLHYADEVRPFTEVPIPAGTKVDDTELTLALKLIEQGATEKFQPERYRDEVKERMQGLIDKKVAGQEITEAPVEEPRAKVVDLMAALRASLEKQGARTEAPSPDEKVQVKKVKRAAAAKKARKG